jgi:hypothetical protein
MQSVRRSSTHWTSWRVHPRLPAPALEDFARRLVQGWRRLAASDPATSLLTWGELRVERVQAGADAGACTGRVGEGEMGRASGP